MSAKMDTGTGFGDTHMNENISQGITGTSFENTVMYKDIKDNEDSMDTDSEKMSPIKSGMEVERVYTFLQDVDVDISEFEIEEIQEGPTESQITLIVPHLDDYGLNASYSITEASVASAANLCVTIAKDIMIKHLLKQPSKKISFTTDKNNELYFKNTKVPGINTRTQLNRLNESPISDLFGSVVGLNNRPTITPSLTQQALIAPTAIKAILDSAGFDTMIRASIDRNFGFKNINAMEENLKFHLDNFSGMFPDYRNIFSLFLIGSRLINTYSLNSSDILGAVNGCSYLRDLDALPCVGFISVTKAGGAQCFLDNMCFLFSFLLANIFSTSVPMSITSVLSKEFTSWVHDLSGRIFDKFKVHNVIFSGKNIQSLKIIKGINLIREGKISEEILKPIIIIITEVVQFIIEKEGDDENKLDLNAKNNQNRVKVFLDSIKYVNTQNPDTKQVGSDELAIQVPEEFTYLAFQMCKWKKARDFWPSDSSGFKPPFIATNDWSREGNNVGKSYYTALFPVFKQVYKDSLKVYAPKANTSRQKVFLREAAAGHDFQWDKLTEWMVELFRRELSWVNEYNSGSKDDPKYNWPRIHEEIVIRVQNETKCQGCLCSVPISGDNYTIWAGTAPSIISNSSIPVTTINFRSNNPNKSDNKIPRANPTYSAFYKDIGDAIMFGKIFAVYDLQKYYSEAELVDINEEALKGLTSYKAILDVGYNNKLSIHQYEQNVSRITQVIPIVTSLDEASNVDSKYAILEYGIQPFGFDLKQQDENSDTFVTPPPPNTCIIKYSFKQKKTDDDEIEEKDDENRANIFFRKIPFESDLRKEIKNSSISDDRKKVLLFLDFIDINRKTNILPNKEAKRLGVTDDRVELYRESMENDNSLYVLITKVLLVSRKIDVYNPKDIVTFFSTMNNTPYDSYILLKILNILSESYKTKQTELTEIESNIEQLKGVKEKIKLQKELTKKVDITELLEKTNPSIKKIEEFINVLMTSSDSTVVSIDNIDIFDYVCLQLSDEVIRQTHKYKTIIATVVETSKGWPRAEIIRKAKKVARVVKICIKKLSKGQLKEFIPRLEKIKEKIVSKVSDSEKQLVNICGGGGGNFESKAHILAAPIDIDVETNTIIKNELLCKECKEMAADMENAKLKTVEVNGTFVDDSSAFVGDNPRNDIKGNSNVGHIDDIHNTNFISDAINNVVNSEDLKGKVRQREEVEGEEGEEGEGEEESLVAPNILKRQDSKRMKEGQSGGSDLKDGDIIVLKQNPDGEILHNPDGTIPYITFFQFFKNLFGINDTEIPESISTSSLGLEIFAEPVSNVLPMEYSKFNVKKLLSNSGYPSPYVNVNASGFNPNLNISAVAAAGGRKRQDISSLKRTRKNKKMKHKRHTLPRKHKQNKTTLKNCRKYHKRSLDKR